MRLATLKDVLYIRETMWERGRIELDALGLGVEPWLAAWVERIQRGDAVAFGSHAILGSDPEGPEEICTAFQASTSFEEHGKAVTKELRTCIPKLMEGRGIKTANIYSLCVTDDAPKWFRLIGFQEDFLYRGGKRGVYTLRKFVRRS